MNLQVSWYFAWSRQGFDSPAAPLRRRIPVAAGLLTLGSNRMFRPLSMLRRGNLPDLVAAGAFRVIHCGIGDGDQIVDRLAAED